MWFKLFKLIFIILLLAACSDNTTKSNNVINITLYTSALGNEGDNYPQDIIQLYNPIIVSGREYIPKTTIKRVDIKELPILPSFYKDEHSTKAEAKLVLKKERETIENSKIDMEFTKSKSSDSNLAKQQIANYKNPDNIFYLKTKADKNSYEKVEDLINALQKRIGTNNPKDNEYLIVYSMNDGDCEKAIGQVKEHLQSIEKTHTITANKVNETQNAVATIKGYLSTAQQIASAQKCPNTKEAATDIVNQITTMKQSAEEALKVTNQAENAVQEALEKLTQAQSQLSTCPDKPAIDSSLQHIAAQIKAAQDAQANAELAANNANTSAQKAKQYKSTLIPKCKINPVPKPIKPPIKTQEDEPNRKPIVPEVKSRNIDEFTTEKNDLHKTQQSIKRKFELE